MSNSGTTLEKELAALLNKAKERTQAPATLAKDLPRLAPRITVVLDNQPVGPTSLGNELAEVASLRSSAPNACRLTASKEELEKTLKLEGFSVWVVKSLTREIIETKNASKWFQLPDNTPAWTHWGYLSVDKDGIHLLLNDGTELRSTDQIISMRNSTRYFGLQTGPNEFVGFAFVTREESQSFQDQILLQQHPKQNTVAPQPSRFQAIQDVLLPVVEKLEKDKLNAVKLALSPAVSCKAIDGENLVTDLFSQVLDPSGRTARLLTFIGQNVIINATYYLRKAINIQCRDVRTAEGWQITVLFTPDIISITHIRREQALDTGPEDYFWFEWEVILVFSVQVTELHAAKMRITKVGFGEKTTAAKQREVRAALGMQRNYWIYI